MKHFFLAIMLVLLSANVSFALSDREYHAYLTTYPEFKEADRRISETYKALRKTLTYDEFIKLRSVQRKWIKDSDNLITQIMNTYNISKIGALIKSANDRNEDLKKILYEGYPSDYISDKCISSRYAQNYGYGSQYDGNANVSSRASYKTPPTTVTRGYVPVISDELMERCVKVYNENEWLSQELSGTHVNLYSQQEVDAYNRKVTLLNQKTDWFNSTCAGKQSRSACEAAQKLNREHGLPVQVCR